MAFGGTGFSFGNNTQNPTNTQQTNTGFSFGAPQTTGSTGFGGFGASGGFGSTNPFGGTTSNAFGNPAGGASSSGTGFGSSLGGGGTLGFGGTTTNTGFGQPQNVTSGSVTVPGAFGGSFGTNTTTTSTGGTFGSGVGGFGASPTPAFGSGAFGSPAKPNSIGLQPSNTFQLGPSATGAFGAQKSAWSFPSTTTATPSLNFTSFNQSATTNPFSFSTSGTGGLNLGPVVKTPYEKLIELGVAWAINHPDYKFQFYFYNMIHPKDMKSVGPPTDRSPALWEQAQKNNSDTSCMVPSLSLGFDGIKKRIEYAQKYSEMSKHKLEELERQIKNMEDKHHMDNLVKIDRCKQKTLEITERMISVMKQLHLKKLKGKPLRPEDERNQAELERIHQKLQRSLQKLEHLNTEVSRMKVQMVSQMPTTQKFSVGDERQLNSIIEVLSDEQRGIVQLIRTVQRDSDDVQEVNNALLKKLIK